MLVSILIPCYNAERWVAQAIESALAQRGPETEIIVVDDGSTDGSLEIIRRFDRQIRWETGPNRGAPAARNRLLELARGEWLQYLDADDYLRPGKIARQVATAQSNCNCDLVYGATAVEVKRGGELVIIDETIPEPHDPWVLLAHWQLPQTGGSLWRKLALERVGGWRVNQPCCQEHELYLRLLQAGCRFVHCDGCLAVYRFWNHGGRLSDRLAIEVLRQRLLVLDRIERHLVWQDQLTPVRHRAINDTRHATARTLWQYDHRWAVDVADAIRRSDPGYFPSGWRYGPTLYALAYRLVGFRAAQSLATKKRQLQTWAIRNRI